MPTLIFSRVGACPPCSPRAGAHAFMIPAYGVWAWWGGGQILDFFIDLHRRPYNTLALLCECVIL